MINIHMALIIKLNAISPVINLSDFAINICMFLVIAISFISNIILLYSYVYVLAFKRVFNFYLFVEKLCIPLNARSVITNVLMYSPVEIIFKENIRKSINTRMAFAWR